MGKLFNIIDDTEYKATNTLIEVKDVTMQFNMPTQKITSAKEMIIKSLQGKVHFKKFTALENVSLTVKKGESLGLIGKNGAGKSTLLKLIAGVYDPTSGSITINGTIAPLLNLGAGFDMQATAFENVFLNGAFLGFSRKEMEQKYDRIVEWSGLSEFMNVPLKNFSSGMVTRLGFAIATDVHPDILLVDEVLAVGDEAFKKKCYTRIHELKESGTTYIIVSHSMDQIKEMCKNAVWIEDHKVKMFGDATDVANKYLLTMEN